MYRFQHIDKCLISVVRMKHDLCQRLLRANPTNQLSLMMGRPFGTDDCETDTKTNDSVKVHPRKILAFGNVLLDHTARIKDTSILERHNLKLEERGELDSATLSKITAEACNEVKCIHNPGGAALNTIRMLKHLGTDVFFFGAVGEDENAKKLRQILKDHDVASSLQTVKDVPTGQCVCLVYKNSTALYANIGASSYFDADHLSKMETDPTINFLRPLERKQIIYMEGFFIPKREAVCKYIVEKYVLHRRRLALNLSAVHIVEENFDTVSLLLKSAFFVFGNRTEFTALSDQTGCCSIEDMFDKYLVDDGKIFAMTDGGKGVTLITNIDHEHSPVGKIKFQLFKAPYVENVVDTTGCGDAFVAGFLHGWLQKRPLTDCVIEGTSIAAKVVTQIGCNLSGF